MNPELQKAEQALRDNGTFKYDKLDEVAERYNLDVLRLEQHLMYLESNGKRGRPYPSPRKN